jgi:hypothetical protein
LIILSTKNFDYIFFFFFFFFLRYCFTIDGWAKSSQKSHVIPPFENLHCNGRNCTIPILPLSSKTKSSPYAFSLPFSHEQLPFSIVDSFPHVSLLLRKKKKKKNIYNQSFSLTIPRPKQFNFNSPLSL